jgi:hypothetical protein
MEACSINTSLDEMLLMLGPRCSILGHDGCNVRALHAAKKQLTRRDTGVCARSILPEQHGLKESIRRRATFAQIFQALNHAFRGAVGLRITGRADTVRDVILAQEIPEFLRAESGSAIRRKHTGQTGLEKNLAAALEEYGSGRRSDSKIKREIAESISKSEVRVTTVVEKIGSNVVARRWGGGRRQERLRWR